MTNPKTGSGLISKKERMRCGVCVEPPPSLTPVDVQLDFRFNMRSSCESSEFGRQTRANRRPMHFDLVTTYTDYRSIFFQINNIFAIQSISFVRFLRSIRFDPYSDCFSILSSTLISTFKSLPIASDLSLSLFSFSSIGFVFNLK
jgi:hypothetical protein